MSNYEVQNNNVGLKIHAGIIEDEARRQIDLMVDHTAITALVAIMADVHAGAGCVIGFTGKFKEAVIPAVLGVDIGCGVLSYKLGTREIDFAKLDTYIREKIPL